VVEIWGTKEHQARFIKGALGEALVTAGSSGPPASLTWIDLVAHRHLRN